MEQASDLAPMIYVFGDFRLDEAIWELSRDRTPVTVPPKVMETIRTLLLNRDRVVSSEELRQTLWHNIAVTDGSVRKAIRIARRILGDSPDGERYIKTTRGRGYRFVADVREERPSKAPAPLLRNTERFKSRADTPFVGRVAELAELTSAFEEAQRGKATLFVVAGDAGMGKTRLAEAFAARAEERGAIVCWGRSWEEGGAPELWPWIQILRELLLEPEGSDVHPMLREATHATPERSVSSESSVDSVSFLEESARFRLFDVMAGFLRTVARRRPLVLVVEDLHTADAASLLFARFLLREVKDASLMVVGTYRPADVDASAAASPFLAKLVRDARPVLLGALSEDATRALILATLPGAPNPAFAERVRAASEGNPFFVSEMVRLADSSTALPSDGLDLPTRIRGVVLGRFDAVPSAVRDLLSIAAVVGREFDLAVLKRVADLSEEAVLSLLEPALEKKLIDRPSSRGTCRFAHVLFRDVLYDALRIARRAELHLRVGEVLEGMSSAGAEAPAAQLAYHFSRAALGGVSARAALHSADAGKSALRVMAFEEASAHFERALGALRFDVSEEPRRVDLLVSLGHALRLSADFGAARETFQRSFAIAKRLGDEKRAGRAALGFAQVKPDTGVVSNQELILVLEDAARMLAGGDAADVEREELFALVLSRLSMCISFERRPEESEALSLRAADIARKLNKPISLARALLSRHWVLWRPGTAEARLALASEVVALGGQFPDSEPVTDAHLASITDLLELGRRGALETAIADHAKLSEARREPHAMWDADVLKVMKALLEGRFAEAETRAHASFPMGVRIHQDNARIIYGTHLWWLRTEQGRVEEVEPVFRQWVESNPANASLRAGLLRVYVEQGDKPSATEQVEILVSGNELVLADDWTRLPTLCHLAAACALLGDAVRGTIVHGLLAPHDGTHVVLGPATLYLGPVSFYLGLAACAAQDLDGAVARFDRAILESRALKARPTTARAECALAEVLLRRGAHGDHARAAVALETALEIARELGCTATMDRALALELELRAAMAKPAAAL